MLRIYPVCLEMVRGVRPCETLANLEVAAAIGYLPAIDALTGSWTRSSAR
jgi:hypothetical protein